MKKLYLLLITIFAVVTAMAQDKMTFQGSLFQDGSPYEGTADLTFSIEIDGDTWTETLTEVSVTNGLYSVVLGENSPIPRNLFQKAPERILTVSVNGTTLGEVTLYPSFTGDVLEVDSLYANAISGKTSNFEESADLDVNEKAYGVRGRVTGTGVNGFDSEYSGVLGIADAAQGDNAGVRGVVNIESGNQNGGFSKGVQGSIYSEEPNATGYAVRGDLWGQFGFASAVRGIASNTQGNGNPNRSNNMGGFFSSTANPEINVGVVGDARGDEDATSRNIGVSGEATNERSVENIGIYGEASGANGDNWAGFFNGRTKVTGDLEVDGNITGNFADPNFNRLNVEENGANASINIVNDPNGGDPNGYSAEMFLFGDETPNLQMGGKPWENGDLGNIGLFGTNRDEPGGGWYFAGLVADIARDSAGNEWGNLSLSKSDASDNQVQTINLDANSGNGVFWGSVESRGFGFVHGAPDDNVNVIAGQNFINGGSDNLNRGGLFLFGSQAEKDELGVDNRKVDISAADDGFGYSLGRVSTGGREAGSYGGVKYYMNAGTFASGSGDHYGAVQLQGRGSEEVLLDLTTDTGDGSADTNNGGNINLSGVSGTSGIRMYGEYIDGNEESKSHIALDDNSGSYISMWGDGNMDASGNISAGSGHISGDLTVEGNLNANIDPNFSTLNVSENGASASINIVNDPNQNDPNGYTAEMFLFGDESPNIQMGGKPWENGDLASLSMYGSNPDGPGGGWYFAGMSTDIGRDSLGQEWGFFELNKSDASFNQTRTVGLDGNNASLSLNLGDSYVNINGVNGSADFATSENRSISFGPDAGPDAGSGSNLPYFFMNGNDGGDARVDFRVEDDGAGDYGRMILKGTNGSEDIFLSGSNGSGYFPGDLSAANLFMSGNNPVSFNNDFGGVFASEHIAGEHWDNSVQLMQGAVQGFSSSDNLQNGNGKMLFNLTKGSGNFEYGQLTLGQWDSDQNNDPVESISLNGETGSGYFAGDLVVDGAIIGNVNVTANPSTGDENEGVAIDEQSVNFVRGGDPNDTSNNGELVVSINSFDDGNGLNWGQVQLFNGSGNTVNLNGQDGSAHFTGDVTIDGQITGLTPDFTESVNLNADEQAFGVKGVAEGTGADNFTSQYSGVLGVGAAEVGDNAGVRGVVNIAAGNQNGGFSKGVQGSIFSEEPSATGYAIRGDLDGQFGFASAVRGIASNTQGNGNPNRSNNMGGFFSSTANPEINVGVVGDARGDQAAGSRNIGVSGEATNQNSIENIGIYGEASNASGDNWAGFFNGNTKITGDLQVDGNISGATSFNALNIAENGASASIGITNDPNGGDPNGFTSELFLWGDEAPNVQMGGKQWENGDLGNLGLFGTNRDEPGGQWYFAGLVADIARDSAGNEWGNLSLSKSDASNNQVQTISMDANSGNGVFWGSVESRGFGFVHGAPDNNVNVIAGQNFINGGSDNLNRGGLFLFGSQAEKDELGVDNRKVDISAAEDGFGYSAGRIATGGREAGSNGGVKYYLNAGTFANNDGDHYGALQLLGSGSEDVKIDLNGQDGSAHFTGDVTIDGQINGLTPDFTKNVNLNADEQAFGVKGVAEGTGADNFSSQYSGVLGVGAAQVGDNAGVRGMVNIESGNQNGGFSKGVQGSIYSEEPSATGYAVRGDLWGQFGFASAVRGIASNTQGNGNPNRSNNMGGFFSSSANPEINVGVVGDARGDQAAGSRNIGVSGESTNQNSIENIGIYGEASNASGDNWAGFFNGRTKVTGDLEVDGNISGNFVDPNFNRINIQENGASASINIVNDPNQNDPNGYTAEMFLFGDETPNIQMGGKPWENGDLGNFGLFGTNRDEPGGGWYFAGLIADIGRDTNTGEEWGSISLSRSDASFNQSQTISLDGNSGNGFFAGDLTVQGSVNNASDKRLKANIIPLNGALDKVSRLRGVSYRWKDESRDQRTQIGVIAQEVEKIYPEFVHTDDKGMKSVNYAQMTAVLIEALKDLKEEVETLKSENTTLEAKVEKQDSLEDRLARLEKLLMQENKGATQNSK